MKQLVLITGLIGSIGIGLLGHSHPVLPGGDDAELPVKELEIIELESILLNPRSDKPEFIPEAAFAQADLAELLPSVYARGSFLHRYEAERAPHLVMDHMGRMPHATCRKFEQRTTEGVGFSPERLEEILVERDAVLTAHVLKAVPGWDSHKMRVATLIVVSVTEVLKEDRAQSISREKTLRFVTPGGRLTYQGVSICDDLHNFDVKEGDEILVAGLLDSDHERMLIAVSFYPLHGDEVIMKATAGTRTPVSVTSLSRLKGALGRAEEVPPQ